jgi:hypothetical protein
MNIFFKGLFELSFVVKTYTINDINKYIMNKIKNPPAFTA